VKLSALRTGLGTVAEIRNGASKTSCEIDDKNQLEKQFISSQVFHRTPGGRVQKITVREQFEPQNLESFDPVTQDLYRLYLQVISQIWETNFEQKSMEHDRRNMQRVAAASSPQAQKINLVRIAMTYEGANPIILEQEQQESGCTP
jgi:hypothetical protein